MQFFLLLGKSCLYIDLLPLCSPCIMSIVVLVDFQFPFEGKTLILITTVPDHCYFFSYSQTLFAILLVYIFNNRFCICSVMLRIFWSFHDVFSQLVPQSRVTCKLSRESVIYPLNDLIV